MNENTTRRRIHFRCLRFSRNTLSIERLSSYRDTSLQHSPRLPRSLLESRGKEDSSQIEATRSSSGGPRPGRGSGKGPKRPALASYFKGVAPERFLPIFDRVSGRLRR